MALLLQEKNNSLSKYIEEISAIPMLTEDRRKEYSKQVLKMAEEAKVSIRNIRRDGNDSVKKDKTIPEDTSKDLIEKIQKETDNAIKKIDEISSAKQKEIMKI